MPNNSLHMDGERLDLLVNVLKQNLPPADLTQLRLQLLSGKSALEGVMIAATRRQLVSAVLQQLETKGLMLARSSSADGPENIRTQLADAGKSLNERRDQLTTALRDIVTSLNRADIRPLIVKGSMSLTSGNPSWRFQRDIDFAVGPEQAEATVQALREVGFRECDGADARPHHLTPMERDGFPATVEPHVKLAGSRARSVLPDNVLLDTVVEDQWQGLQYRRMSNAGFLLHGLAHHHFQNRGYLYGTFSLKGLLEFAATYADMDSADLAELDTLTAGRRRLGAALQLWQALCETVLGCRPANPPALNDNVHRYASRMAQLHLDGKTAFPVSAIADHIGLNNRSSAGARRLRDFVDPVIEMSHTAVWLDYDSQRHKASGIIQEI